MSVPRTIKQKADRKAYNDSYRKSAHGKELRKKWLKTTERGRAWQKSMHLLSRYGITWDQKVQMYGDQNGLCKLCRNPLPPVEHKDCHVDHDHATNKVRGLVHRQCNHLIGWVEKYLSMVPSVLKYLTDCSENEVARNFEEQCLAYRKTILSDFGPIQERCQRRSGHDGSHTF